MSDETLELGRKRAAEIGLKSSEWLQGICYFADDVHRLLGEAEEVFGRPERGFRWNQEIVTITADPDTHKALILGIRPIKQESPEDIKILKERLRKAELLIEMLRKFSVKETQDKLAAARKSEDVGFV